MRRAGLLLTVAVAACSPATVPRPAAGPITGPVEQAAPAGLCRVGTDGGIPVADRGIGGTGAPMLVADRGIGGTGSPARAEPARTGPARTGIVGVITGFASVCLAGQEVEYAPDLPVLVDGRAATLDTLRAGQVAVVVADGARPRATSLAVRHEVSGPIERIEADGALRVAGQRVVPPSEARAQEGQWVLVSGFRREDGAVAATRLDPRSPGEVLVRGIMRSVNGRLWIGLVEVRPGPGQVRQPGLPVVAIGRLNGGVLEADTVEPDALLVDPAVFFGPAVQVLVLEGYAEGGVFRFGGGLRVGAGFGTGRALARLERGPGGGFAPAFVRPGGAFGGAPRFGPAPRGGFEAAPTPNRGMDQAGRDGRGRGQGGIGGQRGRGNEAGFGRRSNEGPGDGGFGPQGGFGAPQGGQAGGFRGPGR